MKLKLSHIPNILTISRIFFTLAVILFLLLPLPQFNLYSYELLDTKYTFSLWYFLAGIMFVIGSITDFVDGYLSRKFNWVSEWGKIWDPITDKVLVNSTLIVLSCLNISFVAFTIVFIVRDTIVDAYRLSAIKKNITVAANKWGKFKTIFQMLAIIIFFFIFNGNSYNLIYWSIQHAILYIALFFSLFSMINYIYSFSKYEFK